MSHPGPPRAIVVLLVGVYLTLICPGHDHGGHHSAPHFAALGEPADEADGDTAAPTLRPTAGLIGTDALGLAAQTATEAPGLTVADVILNAAAPAPMPRLHLSAGGASLRRTAQTSLYPDHPPPRAGKPA